MAPAPAPAAIRRDCTRRFRQRDPRPVEAGSYEVVAHDEMRSTIARRLTASSAKLTIPHFYLTLDCDIGKLLTAREEINAAAPKDKDEQAVYKISVNDFVIKAMAIALQRFPTPMSAGPKAACSSTGIPTSVSRSQYPGTDHAHRPQGGNKIAVDHLHRDEGSLAARARARKLKPEEYQGGTTAVSNLGMYGIKDFAAVINPPHATILAVGASEERPIVGAARSNRHHHDGDAVDAITVRSTARSAQS